MARNFKNLNEVIKKLNAPKEYDFDGEIEVMESSFDFRIRMNGTMLEIFDANEVYNINYAEEMYQLSLNAYYELRHEIPNMKKPVYTGDEDTIRPQLIEALKKDIKNFEVLEWENNVVMTTYVG